ncbi:MAG: type II toxin-antitoxin system RelE/ParE family toxin [Spirochaetaceae bacterium]|nr:type II toxin-antitoxin system RelE/ParE family toxin [Spirochaetaceae bacterium]
MRNIEWTHDGISSLNEILEYYNNNIGENIANNIYNKILQKIESLENEKVKTKLCQELKDIGILDVYELVTNPWKVYYKISKDNKKAYILFILDTRRNIEEILISKVIDDKI